MNTDYQFRFTLYVAGASPRSSTAAQHLRHLCDDRLAPGRYQITVIDVLQAPAEADADRVLMTPTVVRTRPLPIVRVMGDLSATTKIADALGLPVPELR